jgi:large subunit ribosomal protein L25
MATASLSASSRSDTGKGAARTLRRAGRVPAIIYGHARTPQALSLNDHELGKLLQRISPENTVVELDIDGSVARTLIREIQRDPLREHVLHVDFQELVAGEAVTVRVPITLVGTPEGVRSSGGVLDQIMRELSIEVDPSDIPHHIEVDVNGLTVGHALHVSDLPVPAGVTVLDDMDATVCVVSIPKVVEEEAPAEAAVEALEPELIRKPKAEGEEAEGETEEK